MNSEDERADAVVIGAGPAGLSTALNLVRARRRTVVLDANRPRHAATLHSHGFLTRDGVSPLELRRLGREEVDAYADGEVVTASVTSVERVADGFVVAATGLRGTADRVIRTGVVVLASGLREILPALPSIRVYYGTHVHSCAECDGFEKSDAPLALIGDTDDLAERALHLGQWSSDLIVFTNGVGRVSTEDEVALGARGIRVERRPVADLVGERDRMTGIQLADGELIERSGAFVRPLWTPAIDYAETLGVRTGADGYLEIDASGRTSVAGIYAVGDVATPGPQQLIVAAGAGATVAAAINRELIGPLHPVVADVLAAPAR